MDGCAPIALFVYNRPEHTRLTLEHLTQCEGADRATLHIFCDGPRADADRAGVQAVRDIVRQRRWCGTVHVVEQPSNRGLARSIMAGVDAILKDHDRIIVLEDDLVLAKHCLRFMNEGLSRYEQEPRVMQVTGFAFPLNIPGCVESCFLPMISSWGWATWARAWKFFDPNMTGHEEVLNSPRVRRRFDLDGSHFFSQMLERQLEGSQDSWAIRWYLSVFRQGGLTLFPKQTLIRNIGFDGTGTHCGTGNRYDSSLAQEPVRSFPERIELTLNAYHALVNYLRRIHYPQPDLWERVRQKCRGAWNRLRRLVG